MQGTWPATSTGTARTEVTKKSTQRSSASVNESAVRRVSRPEGNPVTPAAISASVAPWGSTASPVSGTSQTSVTGVRPCWSMFISMSTRERASAGGGVQRTRIGWLWESDQAASPADMGATPTPYSARGPR